MKGNESTLKRLEEVALSTGQLYGSFVCGKPANNSQDECFFILTWECFVFFW